MAEFRWVRLPTGGKRVRSEQRDDYINEELTRDWVDQGWEPVTSNVASSIGPVWFLMKRDA